MKKLAILILLLFCGFVPAIFSQDTHAAPEQQCWSAQYDVKRRVKNTSSSNATDLNQQVYSDAFCISGASKNGSAQTGLDDKGTFQPGAFFIWQKTGNPLVTSRVPIELLDNKTLKISAHGVTRNGDRYLRITDDGKLQQCWITTLWSSTVDDCGTNWSEVDNTMTSFQSVLTGDIQQAYGEFAIDDGTEYEKVYVFHPFDGWSDLTTDDFDSTRREEGGNEETDNCYNSGGAKSLGWIVCPLMEWMQDAANSLYNDFIKPSLNIQPTLFTGGNGATRNAWSIFRDIANVCFIIIALVVIFSQLTGVGIDNYGIKKILPKLIVVAILVNLSFILCEICVDLSNILGNFLQSFFDNIGPTDLTYKSIGLSYEEASDAGGATAFSAIGLGAAIFMGASAIWANPAIVLSFFISLLGVAISVLFLFLLLSMRQAAIVILVVISPLAVICYALPNTKTFFDKWLKFFEGLLFVYPIAGLLVGGGNFVSRLLLSTGFAADGPIAAITAMVVGIVPIFFIPTALKGSFAAMGSLGAKISGLGNQLGGAVTRGARNSEFNRNAQERGLQRKHRIESGLDKNYRPKQGSIRGAFANSKVGKAIGYGDAFNQKRRMALNDYKNRGSSNLSDTGAYNQALYSTQMKMFAEENEGRTRGDMDKELGAAVENFNANPQDSTASARLAAAIQTANEKGMNKELMKRVSDLALDGGNSNHAAIINQLAASKNMALSEFGKSRATNVQSGPKSFNQYITSTGEDSLEAGLAKHGEDALTGMDADTLERINEVTSENGFDGASTEMMIKAATKTRDARQLEQLNTMLSRKGDKDNYRISVSDLSKLKFETLKSMDANIYEDAARTLFDGSSSSERILKNMDQDAVAFLDQYRPKTNNQH